MKNLIMTILAASTLTVWGFEPEPKPERIMVAIVNAHQRAAGANSADMAENVRLLLEFWKQQLAKVLPDRPDLILLPETCDSINWKNEEERDAFLTARGEKIRDFFRQVARDNRCYIAYPHVRKLTEGKAANSLELFDRKGNSVGIYDKNFPPISENDQGVIFGEKIPVWDTEFGPVAPLICWDLNFFEDFDHYVSARPKLILFASYYHGGIMQPYWAYRCRSYFLGAFSSGEGTVVNPVGEKIARTTNYFHYLTCIVNLDYQVVSLANNWGKLAAAKAKYGRGITIFDPGHLSAVLLTSEMKSVSSLDILKEFGIPTWDEFYQQNRDARRNKTGETEKKP